MVAFYICTPCFKKDNQSGLIYTETDKKQILNCPYCGQDTLEFKRVYKIRGGQVKKAREYDVAEKITARRRRIPEKKREQIIARIKEYVPSEDPGVADDFEYVPQVDFNPAMRLTDSLLGSASCRDIKNMGIVPVFEMESALHTITNKAGRVDTGRTMAQEMRALIGKLKTLSAFTWANWNTFPPMRGKSYRVDKKRSLEWCHLIGDALGGHTVAGNLVAASYAANTFMLAIEEQLHAKTAIQIKIKAHCSRDHVAELIEYTVYKNTNNSKVWQIDAANDIFSADDYRKYGTEVKDFLK